jgi:hypothetical protein
MAARDPLPKDTVVVTWGQLRRALGRHAAVADAGWVVDIYSGSTGALVESYFSPPREHLDEAIDEIEADAALRDAGITVRVHVAGELAGTYAVPGRLFAEEPGDAA